MPLSYAPNGARPPNKRLHLTPLCGDKIRPILKAGFSSTAFPFYSGGAGEAQTLGNMKSISVTEFSAMSAPELRLSEVKYLFERFKAARNAEPNCGLFLLTVYLDSLLFCLISIEEMVGRATKDRLQALESFSFFKALRNITGHHSILSSSTGKFERPVSRIVSAGVGCSVEFPEQFFLRPEALEAVFLKVLSERPGEKKTIEKARRYLASLGAAPGQILLVDAIQSVITEVEHVAQQAVQGDGPASGGPAP